MVESHLKKVQKKTTATYVFAEAKKPVLLQTAIIVNGETSEKSIEVRIILDSSSQQSNVTCRVEESLNLPAIKRETLIINVRFKRWSALETRPCATNGEGRIQLNSST